MNKCSPKRNSELKNNQISCYSNKELEFIAKAYNKSITKYGYICNTSNCSNLKLINISNNINKLYKDLYSNLFDLARNEEDWLSLDFINNIKDRNLKESLLKFTFKPIGPKNKNDWLNTSHINEIEEQYLDLYKYKNFTFLGAQPSDYSKIKKINYTKLKKYNYIGIIFNKDSHNQPGSHWVSIFIDNISKTVEYFDSLGDKPNKNIYSFLKHFSQNIYTFIFNTIVHQKGGVQCGVYACFFLNKRLQGYTMYDINKTIISNKMMLNYRKILFR